MTAIETPPVRFPASELDALRHAFETEGYCIAAGLFSPDEVDAIRDFFQDVERLREGADEGCFDPGRDTGDANDPLKRYPRYIHPHRDYDLPRRYLIHPGVGRVLTHLLGEAPLAVQSMYYYKPPGARGQGMHQDNIYLLAEPHTCIAAWTAIDDCDRDNGSIMVVPRSHRKDIICDKQVADDGSFSGGSLPLPKGEKAIATQMKAGDTLFFNGQLIHGSAPNRSTERWRRSFIAHYVPTATEKLSKFYHPILNMEGEVVSRAVNESGGPCGGNWQGASH
jgi:ectoine hydroxylase-related dioxygenase (phytanoyl-CoA dioxygenase family)